MMASDHALRHVLDSTKCIACVGMSANPVRPSYFVGRYLALRGYRVVPVNPGYAGQELWGEPVYGALSDIPAEVPVDMVDLFRRSEHVPPLVDEALACLPALQTVWTQIGVEHAGAASVAAAAGKTVIQNKCPKMEHQRLYGELRKAGINTRIISSKLPRF